MRLKLALLTTAVAFGLGTTAALAEGATGATSDITIVENGGANAVPGTSTEGNSNAINPGALSAPEKDKSSMAPSGTNGATDNSAANVPGADADGDSSIQNQGSLSAPEKDSKKM